MAYSRKQFTQSFILFKDKKTVTGYFSTAKMILDKTQPPKDKRINSIRDLEKKIIKALGNGKKIAITFYDGTGFQRIRGYIQSYHPSERKVSIVHYESQWSVRIYDIVKIDE